MPVPKEKTAVVLPNHLGDVAMATPALRSLRRGRPDDEIVAIVGRPLAPLLRGAPWVDRLIPHDLYPAGPLARLGLRLRLARSLRGCRRVIVLPNSWSGALLALLAGAPERIGYARRGRSWMLNRTVPAPRRDGRFTPVAMERYYLDLVRSLGAPDTGTQLELFCDPEGERACAALFAEHGIDPRRPLVCLAPGAGYGPSKLWPLDYVARVADALAADGCQLALAHGPGEEALAEEVLRRSGAPLARLGGDDMDLSLLKSVLFRTRLLICNDAGARHIAAAFEVPTLVLMGPTSIAYTNLNLKKTRLLREPVHCSPCQLKVCPIDHRCMTRLLPERVIEEARAALHDPAWLGDVELEGVS